MTRIAYENRYVTLTPWKYYFQLWMCVFPPIETLQGCLWYFATLNLTKGLSIKQVA